MYTAGL